MCVIEGQYPIGRTITVLCVIQFLANKACIKAFFFFFFLTAEDSNLCPIIISRKETLSEFITDECAKESIFFCHPSLLKKFTEQMERGLPLKTCDGHTTYILPN